MEKNQTLSGNLHRMGFYLCPHCGNLIQSMGPGEFRCCGEVLSKLEAADGTGKIRVEVVDGENYVTLDHPMEKDHYITFLAYVTTDRVYFKKLYPEQNAETSFPRRGLGTLYACCTRDGLFSVRVK